MGGLIWLEGLTSDWLLLVIIGCYWLLLKKKQNMCSNPQSQWSSLIVRTSSKARLPHALAGQLYAVSMNSEGFLTLNTTYNYSLVMRNSILFYSTAL